MHKLELGHDDSTRSHFSGIYVYQDIPAFLQGNIWVHKGYRVHFSYFQCMKSVFMWTNESLNIWTHLIGGLWFLFVIIYDNFVHIPNIGGSLHDHIIATIFDVCFALCLLLSAGYHTFCCHSALSNQTWLALDLAGISMSLIGMYLASLYYGYYCHLYWQCFYIGLVMLFLLVNTYLHTKPDFLHPQWRGRRVVLYCCLVLFGILPASHWYVLMGGWSNLVVQMFIPKLIVTYGLGFLGVLLYVSKLPERLYPGYFDYVGCSHQLWHVVVLCALLWFHQTALIFMELRINGNCSHS